MAATGFGDGISRKKSGRECRLYWEGRCSGQSCANCVYVYGGTPRHGVDARMEYLEEYIDYVCGDDGDPFAEFLIDSMDGTA